MSTNYESAARVKAQAPRPRLTSVWVLTGFAALVLIPLAVAFVKQDLLLQAEREKLGDSLTVSYLTNLLRTDQNNLELRLLLAEHKIYLGDLAGVPAIIEPLLRSADAEWKTKGMVSMYKYLAKQYALGEPDPHRRAELAQRRHAVLLALSNRSVPITTVVYLAREAARLHEREIGVRLYRRIAESSGPETVAACVTTAARLLGEGDYEFAAQLYFLARDKESARAKQREYLIAGIRALMADSLFAKAMQAADEHLGNLENDSETLNFLIQSARAANDQRRAARYARLLLHLSWLERAYAWLSRRDAGLIRTAYGATMDEAPPGPKRIGPYDGEKYLLAYHVFLEDHNLADAFRVAQAAVHQRPNDPMWHKRLAKVAEWLNKPQLALREWLWLMRHGGGQDAVLSVLRIAPALDDYDGALEAWKVMATIRALDDGQWNTLADLFEKAGRQNEGVAYFEAKYEAAHAPLMLELAARLARHNGDDEHARNLYLRLLKDRGFNSAWLQEAANLYLQKGQYQKAYDLLKKNMHSASKDDAAYWKLLADLAWQLQRDEDAEKDYRRLASGGNLARDDISRLITLLGTSKPDDVAAYAELGYKKFGDRNMLYRALEIHEARHDLGAQKRLFAAADADPKADLSGDSRFLLLKARYLQASGSVRAARAVFRHAMAAAPDDADTMTSALWFLIEARDQAMLRDALAQVIARGGQRDPAYWGVFAAAYDVLDQPARAAAYYSRQLRQNPKDFLWMVNYAEALDQAQRHALAMRVRREAWTRLRNKLRGTRLSLPYSPDMLAAARLTLAEPGDSGLAAVRTVLRQDRLAKRDLATDALTSDLVLGWALSNEPSANAKAWLWQRYGETLARPLWADAQVSVSDNDSERLSRMLAEEGDAMPAVARDDAALALNQVNYAQSLAFEHLTANPNDDEFVRRFTDEAVSTASVIAFEARHETVGTMTDDVQSALLEGQVADNVRLSAEFWHTRQRDSTPPVLVPYPATEKLAGLGLKLHSGLGDTEAGVRRISEFAHYTEGRVAQKMNLSSSAELTVRGEMHGEATESNSLRVFGMRNALDATLDYNFGSRAYLSAQPAYARYYAQTGQFLGHGSLLSWEIGHYLELGYSGLRAAVIGINESFRADRAAILPMPPSQNLYGLCLGRVDDRRRVYSTVWRPYFDACGTTNNVSGRGYIAKLGLTGPVAGHDRLDLTFDQEQGGVKVVNGLARVMKLDYRYFFD